MLLTRAPLYRGRSPFSCDLHVLGTPLTFVLSQDQTLQLDPVGNQRRPKPPPLPDCFTMVTSSLSTDASFRSPRRGNASGTRNVFLQGGAQFSRTEGEGKPSPRGAGKTSPRALRCQRRFSVFFPGFPGENLFTGWGYRSRRPPSSTGSARRDRLVALTANGPFPVRAPHKGKTLGDAPAGAIPLWGIAVRAAGTLCRLQRDPNMTAVSLV